MAPWVYVMLSTEYYKTIRRNPHLVCYWRLNDPIGTSAIDRAGKYNINGIYNGTPLNGPGLIHKAIGESGSFLPGSKIFGASEANVEIPDASALHILGNITIECWILSDEKEQVSTIFGKLNPLGSPKYTFADPYFIEFYKSKPVFSLGNGTDQTFITSPVAIPVAVPTYVAATCFLTSEKNGFMKIYINGKEVISGKLSSQEITSTTSPIFIGALGNNTKRFAGAIGDVALYSGALSGTTIKEHFSIGRQVIANKPFYTTYNPPSYS